MYNLYKHEYDAKDCIFGGLNEFKFTVKISFTNHWIAVYPVINASYMGNAEPIDVVRAIQKMGSSDVIAYRMWSSGCEFKDTLDGKVHVSSSREQEVLCAIKSIDELPRVWDEALRLMNKTGIFVFQNRSTDGRQSFANNWSLGFASVPYTGLVYKSVEEGLTRTTYNLDATDENYFYRTIGELTAHYKRVFAPAVLDELVALFKDNFNKAEQDRRAQIQSRMNKLLALQAADKPLPPPPTVNDWWNGLTEVEKETIRTKSVPKPKATKTVKKPAKKK